MKISHDQERKLVTGILTAAHYSPALLSASGTVIVFTLENAALKSSRSSRASFAFSICSALSENAITLAVYAVMP